MIKDENEEVIKITSDTYKEYIGKYFGGCKLIVISNIAMILFTCFGLGSDYIIGDWTSRKDQLAQVWLYSGLSLAFACCSALSISLRVSSIYYFSIRADKKLHEEMIEKVGHAPINLYYDVTPIGRVLNKFSSDLNDLSNWFGMMYGAELSMFYSLLQVVVIAAVALIYFTFIFPLLIVVAFYVYGEVKSTIRETSRLEKMTKSPIVSYL